MRKRSLDLVREGLNSLELVATGADAEDVAEILGIEESEGEQIIARAQAAFAEAAGGSEVDDVAADTTTEAAPEAESGDQEDTTEVAEEDQSAPEAESQEASEAVDASEEQDGDEQPTAEEEEVQSSAG